MARLPTVPPEARRLLELARSDRAAAQETFGKLPLERQVALVCETPASRRPALLGLAEEPERLIPALPPAELCFAVRAAGPSDAGWILEHATASQLTTCVDLDAWEDLVPDPERLGSWLAACADAGDETLLRAAHAVDFECWVLLLQARLAAVLKPNDDDWSPPPGALTLDGQFHLVALREDDDLSDVMAFLRVLFQRDYWVYFRLLQAVIWELASETEEWALRWRSGRLQDLGFPTWEEAKSIYAHLRADQLVELPSGEPSGPLGEWPLPVWMPRLPVGADAELSLFRALAELDPEQRRRQLFALLALANRVAVADGLPLGETESIPAALEKASELSSAGLDHLVASHGLAAVELLQRVGLERLFRIGFALQRQAKAPEAGAGGGSAANTPETEASGEARGADAGEPTEG